MRRDRTAPSALGRGTGRLCNPAKGWCDRCGGPEGTRAVATGALQGAARDRLCGGFAANRIGEGPAFHAEADRCAGVCAGRRRLRIAVLGGGNGSFAAAGDFALQGHEVRLWRRDADLVAAQQAAGSRILVKDSKGRHDVKLALVTTDIADAVHEAELILCPAPAFAQRDIARALAP